MKKNKTTRKKKGRSRTVNTTTITRRKKTRTAKMTRNPKRKRNIKNIENGGKKREGKLGTRRKRSGGRRWRGQVVTIAGEGTRLSR